MRTAGQVMCRANNYPFVRLDGSTSVKKRQTLVDHFNDPARKQARPRSPPYNSGRTLPLQETQCAVRVVEEATGA
jgi:hypothetical protein